MISLLGRREARNTRDTRGTTERDPLRFVLRFLETLKKHSPTRAISLLLSTESVRNRHLAKKEVSLLRFSKTFARLKSFPKRDVCVRVRSIRSSNDDDDNETKKKAEEKEYNYYSPCSTSSSPSSRPGRIGSGRTRCFSTSAPRETRARSPSLATRTRWRCTQSSHR